jgi:hypothetical protein
MRAFRFILFLFGLIIGISFSITPLQKTPSGAEAQTNNPGFDREFSVIEETVRNVVADLLKDSSRDGDNSIREQDCGRMVCFWKFETALKPLPPLY